MQTFLAILLILAMLATLFALVKGVIQFLRTSTEDLTGPGVSKSGERQNRAMRMRIAFQALAIIFVILILMLGGTRG